MKKLSLLSGLVIAAIFVWSPVPMEAQARGGGGRGSVSAASHGFAGHPAMGSRAGVGRWNNGSGHWAGNGHWNGNWHHHHHHGNYFVGFYPYDFWYPWGWYGPYYGSGYYYGNYGGGGNLAANIQHELARDGYYHGPIDGVIGPRTRRAIRAFERANGLPVDGLIDQQLVETMGLG
ncbi:MAG: peptidoglycan-binding domain-containing protein [Chthoniobacterales bacterium]